MCSSLKDLTDSKDCGGGMVEAFTVAVLRLEDILKRIPPSINIEYDDAVAGHPPPLSPSHPTGFSLNGSPVVCTAHRPDCAIATTGSLRVSSGFFLSLLCGDGGRGGVGYPRVSNYPMTLMPTLRGKSMKVHQSGRTGP